MAILLIVTGATTFAFVYYGMDRAGVRAEMLVLAPALLAKSHA